MRFLLAAFFFFLAVAAHAENSLPKEFLGKWPALSDDTPDMEITDHGLIYTTAIGGRKIIHVYPYRIILKESDKIYLLVHMNEWKNASADFWQLSFSCEKNNSFGPRDITLVRSYASCGISSEDFAHATTATVRKRLQSASCAKEWSRQYYLRPISE
jgi:hypothetical protein